MPAPTIPAHPDRRAFAGALPKPGAERSID
jgi:hypothetical protein